MLLNLNHLSQLHITGKDAEKFLQGQATCDIRLATDRNAICGAFCDPKGRMIVSFWVWRGDDGFYILLPKELAETAVKHLKRYVVFSKVNITFLNSLLYEYDGDVNDTIDLSLKTPRQSYLLIDTLPDFLLKETQKSEAEWHAFNIKTGLGWIYPETSNLFIPQMINLEKWNGVGFKKGCYVGQEIIARTQNLGKLKRHLYRAKMISSTSPHIGNDLKKDAQSIGTIIEISKNESGFDLLAVIHDTAFENNTPIFFEENPLSNVELVSSKSS